MRISDWSSDVCSSDLAGPRFRKRSGGCRIDMYRSLVTGCGAYLPSQIVTTADLTKRVDTTDEWIRQRTGIHQRHVAADGDMTPDLGSAAARASRAQAGVGAGDIDLIRCATPTPDATPPAPSPGDHPP